MADVAAPPHRDHAIPADHAIHADHAIRDDLVGGAVPRTGEPAPQRLDDAAVEQRLARVEDLLGRLEQVPGRTAEMAMEAVETLVEVYGEAFARVMAAARHAPAVRAALTGDELVRHLLLLHRVHPDPVEDRVARAVADAAPMLRSHGASAEVLAVDEGVARLQLSGSCGCGSATAVQAQLQDEVLTAAPELVGVRFVDPPRTPTMIPVEALLRRPATGLPTRPSSSAGSRR